MEYVTECFVGRGYMHAGKRGRGEDGGWWMVDGYMVDVELCMKWDCFVVDTDRFVEKNSTNANSETIGNEPDHLIILS